MKKMLALLLAALMAFGLMAPAFAVENTPIPAPEVELLQALGLVDAEPYAPTADFYVPTADSYVPTTDFYVPPAEQAYPEDDGVDAWMAAHPELVQAFRDGGYRDFIPAYYLSDYVLPELWYWNSLEQAIEESIYRWVWQMVNMEERLIEVEALKTEDPELYAQFAANADTYLMENLWYRSPQELKNDYYGMTDAQYVDFLVALQLQNARWEQEKIDSVATYRSEHPGELEAMDWDAYFAEEYYYYYNIHEYMSSYGFGSLEEAYAELEYSYVTNMIWQAEEKIHRAQVIAEKRAALGLPAEGYAVMADGVALTFSQPLSIRHNGLYAPAEELAAAVGLTTSYADLLVEGQLPVRRTAERAGYTVFWDEILDVAVLIDMNKIAAQLDDELTILNRVLARSAERRSGNGTLDMSLVMLDSLDGDKTYKTTLTYAFDWTESAYTMKGSLTSPNFADVAEMIKEAILANMWYPQDDEIAQVEQFCAIIAKLKSVDFAFSYNLETGYATFSLPLLTTLGRAVGENMDAVTEFYVGPASDEAPTLGTLLALTSLSAAESEYAPYYTYEYEYNDSPVYYWGKMESTLPVGMELFADGAFTRKGSEDVLELTLADLAVLLGMEDEFYMPYYMPSLESMLPKFDLFLAVNDKGESRLSFEARTDLSTFVGMYLPISMDVEMEIEAKDAANAQETTMNVHMKNTFKFELKSKVVYK